MGSLILILAIIIPFVLGSVTFAIKNEAKNKTRNIIVLIFMLISAILALFACIFGQKISLLTLLSDNYFETVDTSTEFSIAFKVDKISIIFTLLSAFMWVVSTIFSFEYMKNQKHTKVYYAFLLMSLGSVLGICFSANLITLYMFYEIMTLTTLPLVLQTRKRQAHGAALKYLIYSIAGALFSLFGIFLISNGLKLDFTLGGNIRNTAQVSSRVLIGTMLCIVGFGSKAGLFPLHGWLPTAHPVAPAPASALLSGNITKMGVLAILRVIYYVIGAKNIENTWVQYTFITLTLITVFMGSMMAFKEKVFKKRLAYSTISQVSYVLFGLALLNQTAFNGALLHVIFHSVIKNALFFVSGVIIIKTGKHRVDDLKGIGKVLPRTMLMYTVASLALVGIPPFSGFVSKWYLCLGSLESPILVVRWLGPVVLLVSALLTAGYLFPISMNGFFPGKEFLVNKGPFVKTEANLITRSMLLVLTVLTFFFGIMPNFLVDLFSTIRI